jgi:hypothetical protein
VVSRKKYPFFEQEWILPLEIRVIQQGRDKHTREYIDLASLLFSSSARRWEIPTPMMPLKIKENDKLTLSKSYFFE